MTETKPSLALPLARRLRQQVLLALSQPLALIGRMDRFLSQPMATEYTHSIPTPPFSPQNLRMPDENSENPLRSTSNILDSLVAFYQYERMWIYRTRANMEDAFPTPPIVGDRPFLSSENSSLLRASEGLDTNTNIIADSSAQNQPTTRWNRRKKGFKLRINGIRNKRVFSTQPVGESQDPDKLPPREQILEMFEKMMEARMESCQRVNKLIRDANRADLYLQ